MHITRRIDNVYQAHQQILSLYQQQHSAMQSDLLKVSLGHLETVLEELRLAYEEINEQNQALIDSRQQLDAERQRYQELFNLAPDGYLVTNATGIIQAANIAIAAMLQISPDSLIGKPLLLFFPECDRPAIRTILTQLHPRSPLPVSPIQIEAIQLRRRIDPPIDVGVTLTCSYQSSGQISHIRWLLRDITQQREAIAKIHRQAFYDPLTELPNRALLDTYLLKILAQAQRQRHQVAIAFLDLDRFKIINDTFGHSVGDDILRQVGQRLQGCLRTEDLLVRWGGDEFIIVLPLVRALEDVRKMCDRLITSLQPTFYVDHHTLHISTSIGVAFYPNHGLGSETLLRRADQALYQAKQQGRNTYSFYSMDPRSADLTPDDD